MQLPALLMIFHVRAAVPFPLGNWAVSIGKQPELWISLVNLEES